jgi:hypothetical protein
MAMLATLITACAGATDAPVGPPSVPSTHASVSPVSHLVHTAPTSRPPFRWHGSHVTAAQLGKSWHSGCPVGPSQLRMLTLTYWGFDHLAHHGHLVVRGRVVPDVVTAFRAMYKGRFPIRRMRPISAYDGDDNRSMRHDNTSAFNCRYAVSNGPKHWSMHAYGLAVDIDPRENPYLLDGKVLPPQGKPFVDRSNVRPGMVVPGSVPVRAFTAVGWGWGGVWSSPDYQHFSSTGQ